MNFLLDTHVVMWCAINPQKLSVKARNAILDHDNKIYVSIVSAWEFAIKHNLNKLVFDGGIEGFFNVLDEYGFSIMDLKDIYIRRLAQLPLIHRDPFDRILISTALTEDMFLITADRNIQMYDVSTLW